MLKIGKRVENILETELEVHKSIKVNVELFCTYFKTNSEGEVVRDLKSFNTKNVCLHVGELNFSSYFEDVTSTIVKKSEDFQERDSGWALERIEFLEININKCRLLRGSSYLPLPKWVQTKKACVNVKNNDNACLAWAIVSALYPANKHNDRVSSYPHYNQVLNTKGIDFPVTIADIKKFEKLNNLSINVYGFNCTKKTRLIVPLYISKIRDNTNQHVNLLFFERMNKSHYCWIKDISRLIRAQVTKHKEKIFFCDGCLQYFSDDGKLKLHRRLGCGNRLVQLPTQDNKYLKFSKFSNKMKVPFVIYADFESILSPINKTQSKATFTYNTHKHIPCSFAYYIHCDYDEKLSKFVMYRGEDCVQKFVESLYQDTESINRILTTIIPSAGGTNNVFDNSEPCHICGELFKENEVYVIDHCHLTGAVRGRAHNSCNVNFKLPRFIPVIFHNLSGYDGHLFIKELSKSKGEIHCIPYNKEKYISFSKRVGKITLRFIDSYRFMPSSLEKLVKNLSKEQFKILPNFLPLPCDTVDDRDRQMKLLTRKGVYPYEYVDSWEKLDEAHLPDKESFYSTLCDSYISDHDYQHAQTIWDSFKITTLGEYCDLYLKTDVILLAEVFENFREICINTYELDPCQYVTAPGLSWDAMLKHTQVELELFTDYEMVQFIKAGIRGGISQASKRYSKANNQFMEDYNSNEDSTFIVYLDVNNLYGDAMRRYLPINNFRWLNENEIRNFNILSQTPDSNEGYILEVDLDYPQHLHDSHNSYPFCAESRTTPGGKIKKLLLTLSNKTNYIIHYINLQQAVKAGIELKKTHRILAFNQSPWLKSYIDLNTEKRTLAKNTFEKDFYKLMNNACFGKTMENVLKRVDVKLCLKWDSETTQTKCKYGLERYISQPNFHSATIFSEDLAAVQLNKTKVVYDKPIYVGFTVLELSKTVMYQFHYDYMKPKYGENVSLLYTDTDSFVYEIKTNNFYEDIKPDLQTKFDTSDFPIDNIYNLQQINKKVVGIMKDENSGRIMLEFVALRSKMYAYTLDGDAGAEKTCIKKNKGINAAIVRKLNFNKYYQCLDLDVTFYDNMYNFISNKHDVYTQIKRKKTLCGRDDKRYVLSDKVNTLAWGHYRLNDDLNDK
ncbi:uncharacterized protein [Choristoneura fumiferana]|uniref:uncharacterized protein n=1 Tax=Choristoneura fumiferana TaxID=7141 RepID=UPI003D15B3B9